MEQSVGSVVGSYGTACYCREWGPAVPYVIAGSGVLRYRMLL